jgi:hypothetical protein
MEGHGKGSRVIDRDRPAAQPRRGSGQQTAAAAGLPRPGDGPPGGSICCAEAVTVTASRPGAASHDFVFTNIMEY